MFKRKTGVHAAPTNPGYYSAQVSAFMDSLTLTEKARVVAACKTEGDLELRVRLLKDGSQEFSMWLAVPGTDEALKLVPVPTDDTGGLE